MLFKVERFGMMRYEGRGRSHAWCVWHRIALRVRRDGTSPQVSMVNGIETGQLFPLVMGA